ncbi:MAG: hypothetical protein Q9213_002066 [Squamulea squamosa]
MDPSKKRQRTSPETKTKGATTGSVPLRTRSRKAPAENIFGDTDQTPRPSRPKHPIDSAPKLDAPDAEEASSHDENASNAESTSTSRQRSISPRKARHNMTLAEVAVIPIKIGSGIVDFPAEAKELYRDLHRLQSQHGLLPQSIRDSAGKELEFDEDFYYRAHTGPADTKDASDDTRIWQDILDIRDAARDCYMDDSPESTWNMDVNAPIFRVALRGHWKSQGIWYKDLTAARIFDRDLLPKVPGYSAKSKMVDFGIVIKPRELSPLWTKIVEKCKTQPYQTINQTDAPHLCKSPIAASMEVKRTGGNVDEALVQLETWVTAQYNHLKLLLSSVGSAAELPILPLLQTQGDEWRLIIAEMNSEGNRIILHCHIRLGSTDNILGIYQIIASIQRLAKWISEEYRHWWTSAILAYDERAS